MFRGGLVSEAHRLLYHSGTPAGANVVAVATRVADRVHNALAESLAESLRTRALARIRVRSRIPPRILRTRSRIPAPASRLAPVSARAVDRRNPKPRNPKLQPETRNPKPETRNPKLEPRKPKTENRKPKPGPAVFSSSGQAEEQPGRIESSFKTLECAGNVTEAGRNVNNSLTGVSRS